MITPAEAESIILQHVPRLPAEDCSLAGALGRVLRAPIVADRDLPPFDRVTMDGFAIRVATGAENSGPRKFRVVGFQAAGMRALSLTEDDSCVEIATGAVLPTGADAVVPYEDVTRSGTSTTKVGQARTLETNSESSDRTAREEISVKAPADFPSGSFVHRRGSDNQAGSVLVPAGTALTSREIAVAASCGATTLRVAIQPRIAVIATGDELADVEATDLAPHHVRRSNDYALKAALTMAGFTRVDRFHLRDVRHEIVASLKVWLNEYDVLILSGGISKGKFDFLPSVLTELGVAKQVQGVAQRPGKPFWFGISSRTTPVFALPGNPISTLTSFTRYVLPALRQMRGLPAATPTYAALSEPFSVKPALSMLVPVKLESQTNGTLAARPLLTNTSGDFAGLIGTDGFIEFPRGPGQFAAGYVARFYPWG